MEGVEDMECIMLVVELNANTIKDQAFPLLCVLTCLFTVSLTEVRLSHESNC